MIPEFSVFVGNRVLAWLLSHPSSAPGINELAREAGVSPASAKQYVDIFVRDGIIRKRKAGTAHLVSLNNEYVLVREMKRTFLVARLLEAGVAEGIGEGTETGWIDESGRDAEPDVSTESGVLEGSPHYPVCRGIAPGCISLALYGSGARGTYDEKSDIDLLVVGEESCVRYDAVQAVEEELGFELQVTVIPYYRWEQMLESDDVFARNVFRDHILLGGVRL
ncbi:nucleotidyltransferase domain-containing protein [Methanogenium cariaci]|jgi:DNA-binding transcriptional regulator YhcF (GntR family)